MVEEYHLNEESEQANEVREHIQLPLDATLEALSQDQIP